MNYTIEIISIEGNIGSGKSTLLANLKKYFNKNTKIIFLGEPVDEWNKITDENGVTILEKFYSDQYKYSFSFQMMAYISRLALLKKTIQENQDAIIISERSLYTDKLVFAKMLFDDKKIEDVNYSIYLKWFDTFAQDFPLTGVVYLKTDPKICYERIKKRNRNGEETIPLDYLEKCSLYHDEMIAEKSENFALYLNGNMDIKEKINEWIQEFYKYIE